MFSPPKSVVVVAGVLLLSLLLFPATAVRGDNVSWTQVSPTNSSGPGAPLPHGRVFASSCRGPRAVVGPLVAGASALDNDPEDATIIYVSGGIEQWGNANAPTVLSSDLWMFDPTSNFWTALPSLPVQVYGHAMVFVPSVGPLGRILIIGGYQGPLPFRPSNRVAIYDVATGQYLTAQGNPDPDNNIAQSLPNSANVPPRAGHAAAFIPPSVTGAANPLGIVVVFGGDLDADSSGTFDGPGNDLHYIDINTMTWDSVGVNITGASPSPRCYTKMWFNGWNNSTPTTSPAGTGLTDGGFTDLFTVAPTAGTNVPGAFLTSLSRAYLFGGTDANFDVVLGMTAPPDPPLGNLTHFSDVFRLSSSVPPNFAWQPVIPSGFGPSPNPRVVYNQLAASPEDMTAFIFGGSHVDFEFYNDVYRLRLNNLGTESWEIFGSNVNPPTIRAYGTCEIVGGQMFDFFGFFDSDGGTQTRMGPEASNDSFADWYNTVFRMGVQATTTGGGGIGGVPSGSSSSSSSSGSGGGGGGGGGGGSGCFVEEGSSAPVAFILALMLIVAGAIILRARSRA